MTRIRWATHSAGYTLAVGDSIREFTVSEIRSDSISITSGSQVHRLTLDSEDAS